MHIPRQFVALSNLRKYLYDLLDSVGQFIDLFLCVIESERCASGCGHVKELHHRLRAMMAGTNGYSLLIEDRADIVRMYAFDRKRQNARLIGGRPDDPDFGNVRQTSRRIFKKRMFVFGCRVEINGVQIIDRGTESDACSDAGRARGTRAA